MKFRGEKILSANIKCSLKKENWLKMYKFKKIGLNRKNVQSDQRLCNDNKNRFQV